MIETEFAKELITLRMIGMITDEDWDSAVSAFEQALGTEFGVHVIGTSVPFCVDRFVKIGGLETGRAHHLHPLLHGLPGSRSSNSNHRIRQV